MKLDKLPDVAKPTPKGIVLVKAWQLADERGFFGAGRLFDYIEESHPDIFNITDVYYYLGQLVQMGELSCCETDPEGFPLTFKRAEKPWKVHH